MFPRSVQLDARLSLVFDLYDECDLAADIGTDHARLPAALLQRGRCLHMILTDISPEALQNARSEIVRCGLEERTDLRLGNGITPLKKTEKCQIISITGMGGRTIHDILISGQHLLNGASLIISAHTDWPLVRQAVHEIGYHLEREEPCFDSGRYYLVIRARPGYRPVTDLQLRLGGPVFGSSSPVLIPFLCHRKKILEIQLSGMLLSLQPDPTLISQLQTDIRYLEEVIKLLHNQEGKP